MFRRSLEATFLLTLFLALILIGPYTATVQAATKNQVQTDIAISINHSKSGIQFFYLPFINKAPQPFTGKVILQGLPAADVNLRMFLYTNGGNDQVVFLTKTDSDGTYSF